MTIKAYRSGETARHWTNDCHKEKLTHGTDKVVFTLSMPSKGGGVTEVQLQVTSESFESLAQSMRDANENAATRAFASAGRWDLMLQTMIDTNKEQAIWKIGEVLKNNVDDIVRACGTILFDHQHKLIKLLRAKLSAQRQGAGAP
jgi:hypothetical protein